MPNHVHLIAAADNLHAMLRDFKRFTSRTIHERLVADGRETVLAWLARGAQRARLQRDEFSFWEDGFHPQEIVSRRVFEQKLRYLRENPVRKGLVAAPEHWWYSSAAWYVRCERTCMEMDVLMCYESPGV
jgi:REP element-mobilizing transposase RayT